MRMTVKVLLAAVAVVSLMAGRSVSAAPETWRGKVSDAMCGASHGAQGGTMEKDHDCAVKCAKKGGFVFVTMKDKKPVIFKIANQDLADLTAHAGHDIDLTGELKGDTITVSKVVMLPVKK